MPSASAFRTEARIFALFTGRSGDGKSVAAASFAEAAAKVNKQFLDLDFDYRFGGIKAAIDQGILKENGIVYEQFSPRGGWEPVDKQLQVLEAMKNNFPYGCICTDSLTSLTRLFVVSSHSAQKGKMIGKLRVSGPGDFNFEASATHQYFDIMRTLPCHVICSAHVVDKYGKLNRDQEYSETGVVGEKLSVRDNLGENVQTYFDNVFRFSREVVNGKTKFYVEFATDLAKNSFGIPPGRVEWTNMNFYDLLQEKILEFKKK